MIANDRIGLPIAAILGATLWCGGAVGAAAPDGTTTPAPTPAVKPVPSTQKQPSPEMQSLTKAIAGRWSTEIVNQPSGATSAATVKHGEQVWRSGPGGFTLLEEERIGTGSGEQFLLAVHWWDQDAKQFKGLLCNNSGPGACNVDTVFNSSLAWDGKTLKIDLEFPQQGKKMRWHEEFSDFTANSFLQTGDMGEIGGPLQRVLVIHATRIGSPL